jgi:ribosomal protein S18 acetylase RimI-like enzyme
MSGSLLGVLRLLGPTDWEALRAVRLQALIDSPHAFSSSYQEEQNWTKTQWCQLIDAATWIAALQGDCIIGIACLTRGPAGHSARYLESAWVAPTHRRRKILQRMFHLAVEIGRAADVRSLLLWVLEGNDDAQEAWSRLGFVSTDKRQLAPDARRYERRMLFIIQPATAAVVSPAR